MINKMTSLDPLIIVTSYMPTLRHMESEVNEAPNFEVFTGKNCAESRSMKQPFCFIMDKKSTSDEVTTKSFAAVYKPKNAFRQHLEDYSQNGSCVPPLTSKFLVQPSNTEYGGLETTYKDSHQMFQHSDRMFEQIFQISFKISFGT